MITCVRNEKSLFAIADCFWDKWNGTTHQIFHIFSPFLGAESNRKFCGENVLQSDFSLEERKKCVSRVRKVRNQY